MWILKFVFDLRLIDFISIAIFCDNESSIKLVLNPVFHEKTKHFDVDTRFIRDRVSKGVVEVLNIDSDLNIADIFTKALGFVQHNWLCDQMRLVGPFQEQC